MDDEWEWLDRLAAGIGERPVGRAEIGALLRLARDVARGTERKLAPLSTYLAGVHVGRRTAEGGQAHEALQEVLTVAGGLLPGAEGAEGAG